MIPSIKSSTVGQFTAVTVAALIILSGCMTLPSARPLEASQHQVGLTLGGPAVMVGDAAIPLPNANIEGRTGLPRLLDRSLDINYGINSTAIGFGVLQIHLGISWMLFDQQGPRPALTVTNRLFFAANILATGDRAPNSTGVWAADQLELTFSYLIGQHLLYAGLGQYFDFASPSLLITPSLGFILDPGAPQGWSFFVESRYFAVNQTKDLTTLRWLTEGRGALGVALGFGYTFGGDR